MLQAELDPACIKQIDQVVEECGPPLLRSISLAGY